MDTDLRDLEARIERLEAAVGKFRDQLLGCLRVAEMPQQALLAARTILEGLTAGMLEALDEEPHGTIFARIQQLESEEVKRRGLVPAEIVTLLHMVRVIGNKAAHDDLSTDAGPQDVDLVVRAVLRIVEWYFSEFEGGPRVSPLYRGAGPLPALASLEPPPEVRMPPLVIAGDDGHGPARKVFVFTERLLGFGREKTSRDPRVHIVARLLPCPDRGHPNFNLNLENVSRFHAQLWWHLGRAEVRDESSDRGVLLNGVRIAPGVWTSCLFESDPAQLRLGPRGVEVVVREIVRQVPDPGGGGRAVHLPFLRLARLENWPFHTYLLVSRPLVTIGSDPANVAWFPDGPERAGVVLAGERGWTLRADGRGDRPLEPGAALPLGDAGLTVKRASEEDFLS